MSFEEDERAHCEAAAAELCEHVESAWDQALIADRIARERALAREQLLNHDQQNSFANFWRGQGIAEGREQARCEYGRAIGEIEAMFGILGIAPTSRVVTLVREAQAKLAAIEAAFGETVEQYRKSTDEWRSDSSRMRAEYETLRESAAHLSNAIDSADIHPESLCGKMYAAQRALDEVLFPTQSSEGGVRKILGGST
jgi:hypothetical protein